MACRLLKNCWNGTAGTNATENIGDLHGDGNSEMPPQYTLLSNRNMVSEVKEKSYAMLSNGAFASMIS